MAYSKSFFGMRRGKVGGMVFSILDGKQITRSLAESVKNPQTSTQMYQRIKMYPAVNFYKAFGSVLNHSFENTAYGYKSRQKFIGYALRGNIQTPFVVKGYSEIVPGEYLISDGRLGNITGKGFTVESDSYIGCYGSYIAPRIAFAEDGTLPDRATVMNAILDYNGDVQLNDKLTFLLVTVNNIARTYQIIVNPEEPLAGDDFQFLQENRYLGAPFYYFNSNDEEEIRVTSAINGGAVGVAEFINGFGMIISRGEQPNAYRTHSTMGVSPLIINRFFSDAALQVAIASYSETASETKLSDDWYLNYATNGLYGRVIQHTTTYQGRLYIYISLVVDLAGIYEERVIVSEPDSNNNQFCLDTEGHPLPFTPQQIGWTGKTIQMNNAIDALL